MITKTPVWRNVALCSAVTTLGRYRFGPSSVATIEAIVVQIKTVRGLLPDVLGLLPEYVDVPHAVRAGDNIKHLSSRKSEDLER